VNDGWQELAGRREGFDSGAAPRVSARQRCVVRIGVGRAGRFQRPNPIADVKKLKVPRRQHDYLRAEEVGPVLDALSPRWRPLFATAIYTGLRKGELLGLRKADVDLQNRLLTVARSYGRQTTKGKHADVIPIAKELVPFLEIAFAVTPSALVFPRPDGSMMREEMTRPSLLMVTLTLVVTSSPVMSVGGVHARS